jgi:hypothetical protein
MSSSDTGTLQFVKDNALDRVIYGICDKDRAGRNDVGLRLKSADMVPRGVCPTPSQICLLSPQIAEQSRAARADNHLGRDKTDIAHPCRGSGIYDYSPLLNLSMFDPTKDVM